MQSEPKWIAWEITRRCNLRCIHCRSSSENTVLEHPDPTKEECLKIIDDITSYAKPVLVLTGGEPLLREDFFEIADYAGKKGLRVCLATNGTLVNEEICEKLKAVDIKMVSLSLDGPNERVHDDFRNQQGAFRGTINAIELFKKHGIPFLINSSFTKRNQEYIPQVYELAKSLGATAWYMFMIVPTGRAEELLNELIDKEDYENILNWHYDMEKKEKDILVRPTCAPQYYRIVLERSKKDGEKFERRSLKFSTGGAKGCVAGQLICLINVDGDVMPCSYFPLPAGNIKKQSFKEIWENSEIFKDLREFSRYKGRCNNCEYINVCGGCRARAYCLKGDYLQEDPYCKYTPRRSK
ncbi:MULTISPECIES: radical SAM/SPASM domain-containing protein [Thermodesulfovibrio]|jgi:radical SAM protein with 4Fe4S-binding SPASM domain|uniref:radical SAM/SPASM domain-containing protein n=1 Tax=Thermodesulfovibrio TaxID=28261 RepID=UPI00260A3387|nr:radical SAM protein [Thermodesulfovibrio sp.]